MTDEDCLLPLAFDKFKRLKNKPTIRAVPGQLFCSVLGLVNTVQLGIGKISVS